MMRTAVTDSSIKDQLEAINGLVYRNFGIHIGREKFPRFGAKLDRLLETGGYSGLDEVYNRLVSGDGECMEQLASCITTCHTFFFRESGHFKRLVSLVRQRPQRMNRIWCAACSTGEEPYSIAMTLLDSGIHNFHIIASDLNRQVLEEFNRGMYHESRLSQTPPETVRRYFTRKADSYYEIDRTLRDYISIKNLNLMDRIVFCEAVDYVFCRNVFIYFDEKSRMQALKTIAGNLKPGGTLFIGHAEVLMSQPDCLKKTGDSEYCRIY